jgi:hypothetical protein
MATELRVEINLYDFDAGMGMLHVFNRRLMPQLSLDRVVDTRMDSPIVINPGALLSLLKLALLGPTL